MYVNITYRRSELCILNIYIEREIIFWLRLDLLNKLDGLYLVFTFGYSVFIFDRLCGLVVRVSGHRYRGPGFDSRRYQIF
jgi:hypothetical protein